MKKAIALILFILLFGELMSHPGIGIVKDSKGNIFYTDLKHIWKLTPDGKKTIAVSNVHSHEIYLDKDDNLFGEHLWYEGEATKKWGHYVWCLRNDGKLEKIINNKEGFLSNYSFKRDDAGNMYWVERFNTSRFMKKTPDGRVSKFAEGKFKNIRWMISTKEGILYFIDAGESLYRIDQNSEITEIASKLGEVSSVFTVIDQDHNAYAPWIDSDNNVYVPLLDSRKVKRVSPDGKIETVLTTAQSWGPAAGLFDEKGNLWLLEYGGGFDARVRMIAKNDIGKETGRGRNVFFSLILPFGLISGFLVAIVLLLIRLYRFLNKKLVRA